MYSIIYIAIDYQHPTRLQFLLVHSIDCARFLIVYSIESAYSVTNGTQGNGVSTRSIRLWVFAMATVTSSFLATSDQGRMRSHLIECFENGKC